MLTEKNKMFRQEPLVGIASAGKINNVPIMTGTVANESIQFIWLASPTPLDKLDYDLLLDELFGLEVYVPRCGFIAQQELCGVEIPPGVPLCL